MSAAADDRALGPPRAAPCETAPARATAAPETASSTVCFHCGESCAADTPLALDFDGRPRPLCCHGCEAVMRAILDAGLESYYRHRDAPASAPASLAAGLGLGTADDLDADPPGEAAAAAAAFAIYDEPELRARFVVAEGEGHDTADASGGSERVAARRRASEVVLAIEGMRCGACGWLVERALATLPGILDASANVSTGRARLRFDAARLPLSAILGRIAEVGYRALPFDARAREASLERESRRMLGRLFVAAIAMMQVMMYALPAYIAGAGGVDETHERLLRWASLVLTTPVMLYSAQPFLAGAWRDLKARSPGMDVPVAIGLLAAFSASVHATLTMRGEIWFDSVAMFVFLLLGARWLEWRARRRALRAIDALGVALPDVALRLGPEPARVPAARLVPGDRIRVGGGERVPVDARVASGDGGAVDLALLSGESEPLAVAAGALVPGGALVSGAPLELVVERGVAASAPSTIERLIERGAGEKPRLARLADRVARRFVATLLVFAAAVYAFWLWHDPARAASVALATLIVSCPCALSLATPAALAAATGRLFSERLLITRGHAIETLARVTDVVLDKTGTLTLGRPELVSVATAADTDRATVLAFAARLEEGSPHPLGRALAAAARGGAWQGERGVDGGPERSGDATTPAPGGALRDVRHESGRGTGARIDGATLRLGSAAWCGLSETTASRWRGCCGRDDGRNGARRDGGDEGVRATEAQGAVVLGATSEAFLVRETDAGAVEVLARFGFVDPPRPEAGATLARLGERGLALHLLSGDRPEVVGRVADALGIASRRGGATPADKQRAVAALQAEGRTVLMVGDGVNDAPVLALADVSLAVGEASALARTAADAISLAPGLEGLAPLLETSARAVRVLRQNLLWAASYNLVAIPAAALGFVPPWAAAIGMAGSSLLVAGNALRLAR